ncbi:MAG: hypothetical protein LBF27_25790 [Sphingobacterium sp.]|jgi:hypothetical protein|nr:hypothetical protein [Sphingobacterium sp.]
MATLDIEFRTKGFATGDKQVSGLTTSVEKLEGVVAGVSFESLTKHLQNVGIALSSATTGVNGLSSALSSISSVDIGKSLSQETINQGTKSFQDAKVATEESRKSAIDFASALKGSLSESLNNVKLRTEEAKQTTETFKQSLLEEKKSVEQSKSALEDKKKELIDSKVAIDNAKAATELQRLETEKSKTSYQQIREAIAAMTLAHKQNRQSIEAGKGSIVEMRTRLNELRAIYDRLSESSRNSAKVQSNLVPEIQRLDVAITEAEQSTGRFQRQVGKYGVALGNANGIAQEFNRIIQDAPFGMMGMGNNIQQLVSNWQTYVTQARAAAAQTGATVSTMALAKGAIGAIISPINLLTLGISLATAGWTAYTMYQQKAKKSNDEMTDSTKKLTVTIRDLSSVMNASVFEKAQKIREEATKTLRTYEKAQIDAGKSALDESRNLKTLYEASQDQNRSVDERTKFIRVLKSEYPEYLEKFSNEEILAGKAASAYDRLTTSIQNTAKARVYGDVLSENLKKEFENQKLIAKLRSENAATQAEINKNVEAGTRGGMKYAGAIRRVNDEAVSSRNEQIKLLETQNKSLGQDNIKLESDINKLLGDRLDITKKIYTDDQNAAKKRDQQAKKDQRDAETLESLLSRISGVFEPNTDSGNLLSLEGLDKIQKATENKYQQMINNVDAIEKQGVLKHKGNQDAINKIVAQATTERSELQKAKELEVSQNAINFAEARENKLNELYQRAGMTRTSSREKDLQADKIYWENILANAEKYGISEQQVAEMRGTSISKINEKWDGKALEDVAKIQDKIRKVEEKPFKSGQGVSQVKEELDKRLKQIEDFYNQIYDILNKNGLSTKGINMTDSFKNVTENYQGKNDTKLENRLSKVVEASMRQGIGGILGDINQLGSNFQQVFNNVFNKLASNLNKTLQDVIATELGSKLSQLFKSDKFQIGNLSKDISKGIVAGAGIAGGLISSMTSPTSKVGQGLGGALSGAAAGAALGPWGALAGGLIGGLSGIFGASQADKARKLQEQQVLEQKRTNMLLERQQALSFTSSITGQSTNQGIVTGVERNEFGDITFEIEGRKLKAVMDKENIAQGRGMF